MTDPGPVETDILLNKLRPGHEMEMRLFAVKVVLLLFHNVPHEHLNLPLPLKKKHMINI